MVCCGLHTSKCKKIFEKTTLNNFVNASSKIFLFILAVAAGAVHADFPDDIYGLEEIGPVEEERGPFRFEFEADYVTCSHFKRSGFTDQTVTFQSYSGLGNCVVCYLPQHREAYSIGFGYNYAKIDWAENPYFNQTDFNSVTAALRLFSNRLCDWLWIAEAAATVSADHFDFNNYLDFDLLLWGRYSCRDFLGFHIGFIAQTGMRIDRLYPLVGFDWKFRPCWKLNAVFPVNISLERELGCNWTALLAMRFFDVRHKVGSDEPLPQALVTYRNAGIELGIGYEREPRIEANIHAGITFGGQLRIATSQNRNPQHFNIKPSPYCGGELVLSF